MTQSSFNAVAVNYDAQFTHSATGRLQRAVVHRYLQPKIQSGTNVLELNCGTGEDALWLARQGCSVLATDSAPEMVNQTAAKIETAGLQDRVETRVLDMRKLDLPTTFVNARFDLILSNFGGLNCLAPDELHTFGKAIPELLKPGGLFAAVVMPRFCLWETKYFFLKGQFRKASRRWNGGPVEAPLNANTSIPTWYYSPGEFRQFFPKLRLQTIQPVGFWLPPSYLDPWFSRRPRLLQVLDFLEKKCRGRLWAFGADHVLLVFLK